MRNCECPFPTDYGTAIFSENSSRHFNPIAPRGFALIERRIGFLHGIFQSIQARESMRNPDRDRAIQRMTNPFDNGRGTFNGRSQALRQKRDALHIGVHADDNEFFSPVANRQITSAHMGTQYLGHMAQHLVPGLVPV